MTSPSEAPAERARSDEPNYAASRRAATRCLRELEQLTAELVRGAEALKDDGVTPAPTIRRSPNRTIIQLGGVALTIAWLQGTHASVAEGELLVILWNGEVAPAPAGRSDQTTRPSATRSATALWEGIFAVDAQDENTWFWRNAKSGAAGLNSSDLAAESIARLQAAYLKVTPATARAE
jgi:hypothetical protein